MQFTDLNKKLNSRVLNENLAKNFGYELKLNEFSNLKLEDARNKLLTKLSQLKTSKSFDNLNEDHDYNKTRLLLDVINQEIFERTMSAKEKAKEKKLKKKYDPSDMKSSMQKQYGKDKGKDVYFATIRKRAMDESVPDSWIKSALTRIKLNECTKPELKAELQIRYDLSESMASWVLCEDEELKAEIIMATKDMVDRITGWIEDVSAMKSEQLLELIDSVKDEFGPQQAQQYNEMVKPTLEALYTALETARQGIDVALDLVSGNEISGVIPGAKPGTEPQIQAKSQTGQSAMPEPTAMPEPAETERVKRESVEYSHRLGVILNSKKNF